MFPIEKATLADLGAILSLDRQVLGNESRSAFLANALEAGRCWIARQDVILLGFSVLELSFYGHAFISLLIVDPEHRRRGVARTLLQRMLSICPTEKLFTSTNRSNLPAQRLFEASGFIRSGLDEGDPEIVYFKRVRNEMS